MSTEVARRSRRVDNEGLEHIWPKGGHKVEEVLRGLMYLVDAEGDPKTALYHLKRDGIEWPDSVRLLTSWKTVSYPRRYTKLAGEYARQFEETLVVRQRESARKAADLADAALDRARALIGDANATDAAKIAQQASVSMGIHTDKMLLLGGRPTQITEQRDAAAILASLAQKIPLAHDAETTVEDAPGE